AYELLARRLRVLPALEEETRIRLSIAVPVDRDFAELAGRELVALLVDHRHAVTGIRPANRAGLHRPCRLAVAHHVVDLRLAEHLVDGHAELLAGPVDERDVHRFSRAQDRLKTVLLLGPSLR